MNKPCLCACDTFDGGQGVALVAILLESENEDYLEGITLPPRFVSELP